MRLSPRISCLACLFRPSCRTNHGSIEQSRELKIALESDKDADMTPNAKPGKQTPGNRVEETMPRGNLGSVSGDKSSPRLENGDCNSDRNVLKSGSNLVGRSNTIKTQWDLEQMRPMGNELYRARSFSYSSSSTEEEKSE